MSIQSIIFLLYIFTAGRINIQVLKDIFTVLFPRKENGESLALGARKSFKLKKPQTFSYGVLCVWSHLKNSVVAAWPVIQ